MRLAPFGRPLERAGPYFKFLPPRARLLALIAAVSDSEAPADQSGAKILTARFANGEAAVSVAVG